MLSLLVAIAVAPADLVVENAVVWTDGHRTKDTFVAIEDGRFVYVGASKNSRYIGAKTIVLDAKGKVLLPGFVDSHTHLMDGGASLTSLNLRGANTKAEFLRRIKEWADKTPGKETIVGNSWSAESWPDKSQPTRQDLDSVTGEHPAVLYRMDGHSLIVNTIALKKLGITKDTKSPEGGSIDKDPTTDEPTGLLRETAMARVGFILPPTTPKAIEDGLRAAAKMMNTHGFTAVSEVCSTGDFPRYVAYASSADASLRFALFARATNWTDEIRAIQSFKGVPEWVGANGIKAYMDGSLGSRTAWMLQSYTKPLPDQKSLTGLPRPGFTDGTYKRGIKESAKAGLQVIVHAIGDRANREILSTFFECAPNLSDLRFRVEHAQHLTAVDIARFGSYGVIPSMQPYHKADDGRYCEEVIGTDRSRTSYAFKDLLASHAHLAFGSDWPVVDCNPWLGIETAVTGKTLKGNLWMTHQNISIDQALTAYTSGGAYAMKRENDLGQIKEDYIADFQILNQSPFAKKIDWTSMRPEHVYVNGRRVF